MLNNETKIIIAGFGGQGVVMAANILAHACMIQDLNVTAMVSYGAEIRGGTANSTVVISDKPIASPVIENPDVAIILNQPSLDKFEKKVAGDGLVVINSSLVERDLERQDLNVVQIAATTIAGQLGNVRVANVVSLGAFVRTTALLKAENIEKAIEAVFSGEKSKLVDINKKAFQAGLKK